MELKVTHLEENLKRYLFLKKDGILYRLSVMLVEYINIDSKTPQNSVENGTTEEEGA